MNEENIDELIHLLELADRWKTRSPSDPLNGFHIKIKDYNTETKIITYSWWDGKAGWEDNINFEEFRERFEVWYAKPIRNDCCNQCGNIWNDFDSEVYRDGEERDLKKLIDEVNNLVLRNDNHA